MDILPQLLVNALISGSIYALASVGLALTYGLLRILNFAHGHILMLGAYIFYFLYMDCHYGVFLSSILCMLFSVLFSVLTLQIFILPFLRFSYVLPLVTTLALSTLLESIVSLAFGVNVKSLNYSSDLSSYEFHGIYITPIQIVIICSALVLLLAAAFVIHLSSAGRKIRALSEIKHAAEATGINSTSVIYIVFSISTILSVFAGVMIGFETNLQPTMGNSYTVKAFAAMILGGLGNIWGTIIGSYLLGLIENLSIGLDFGSFSLPAGYKDAFAFMIILLVLLFRPQGIFRKKARSA